MGLIKDLVDLATQLDRSITDRKTRELLLPLQEKILAVQKEQLRLQQEHAEEIASLKQAHANEIAKLRKPPSEQTTNPHVVTPDQEKILGFVAARKDGAADELVAGRVENGTPSCSLPSV